VKILGRLPFGRATPGTRPRGGSALRSKIRRRLLPAIALLAAAPVAGFAWFLTEAALPPADPLRRTDGIAVLTGGAERVESGLRLLREGRADWLIVSGVHPDVTLAELVRLAAPDFQASPMAATDTPRDAEARDAGVAERITLGRAATTTRGNAAEIAAWAQAAGLRSIRVVTAGYHMPRATLELRRALPEATLLPHPVLPARLRGAGAAARLRTWSLLLGEYLKWLGAAAGLSSPAAALTDP